jgi:hypothetical protein
MDTWKCVMGAHILGYEVPGRNSKGLEGELGALQAKGSHWSHWKF